VGSEHRATSTEPQVPARQPPTPSRQRWYRSLYWRIAIGFILTLAAMLVVQATLFVWVLSRGGPMLPGQPERFGQTVAADVGDALRSDRSTDLAAYIGDQYSRDAHPFFVMLADGRVFANFPGPYPEPLLRGARARLQRGLAFDRDRFRRGPGGRGRGFGPGGPPPPPPEPIMVDDELAGVVVVLPRAPFWFLLRRYAPTLGFVAAAALAAGAAAAALLIFGPPRRRLRSVEEAARRLGSGDLSARAPVGGGDEVTAMASTFNAMADDLAARANALAAANRARRQLLADVSHELTTPVTAMRGYLETLTMPELALDDETRARYLAIVSDETARLERLIGDLLDLAKLEGGGGALVVEDVPLADLFGRVAARHERDAGEAGVSIVGRIEPGAERVRGDRGRLEQAVQNLAANALRFAPRGSSIELRARAAAGGVAITVTDQGAGIPEEHLPHVFDRFYKGDAARTQTGGSGLGLSIVKAIVERHGGAVTVESRPGRTVFALTLTSTT
jgi:two-component system, OmpR family, sensor kinase